jgi:hypothetical protein
MVDGLKLVFFFNYFFLIRVKDALYYENVHDLI